MFIGQRLEIVEATAQVQFELCAIDNAGQLSSKASTELAIDVNLLDVNRATVTTAFCRPVTAQIGPPSRNLPDKPPPAHRGADYESR